MTKAYFTLHLIKYHVNKNIFQMNLNLLNGIFIKFKFHAAKPNIFIHMILNYRNVM